MIRWGIKRGISKCLIPSEYVGIEATHYYKAVAFSCSPNLFLHLKITFC